jgi:hypothetical protein
LAKDFRLKFSVDPHSVVDFDVRQEDAVEGLPEKI